MSTVHATKSGFLVAAKGSVEATLDRCTHMLDSKGKKQKLTPADKTAIQERNKGLSSQALRVLAFAQKEVKT